MIGEEFQVTESYYFMSWGVRRRFQQAHSQVLNSANVEAVRANESSMMEHVLPVFELVQELHGGWVNLTGPDCEALALINLSHALHVLYVLPVLADASNSREMEWIKVRHH